MGEQERIYEFRRTDPGAIQKGIPDSRLPMKEQDLADYFSEQDQIDKFLETQFIFLVPTFPQGIPHRTMAKEIRLPFLKRKKDHDAGKNKPLGGNFGKLTEEKLPPLKYGVSEEQVRIIR
jgi:hypothetical protein